MADGADPAVPAPDEVGRRVDEQPPSSPVFSGHRQDDEALPSRFSNAVAPCYYVQPHVLCPPDLCWCRNRQGIGGHGALQADAYVGVTLPTPPHG